MSLVTNLKHINWKNNISQSAFEFLLAFSFQMAEPIKLAQLMKG